VLFVPTIAFWTPFATTSRTTRSGVVSWPTSRLPPTRSAITRKRYTTADRTATSSSPEPRSGIEVRSGTIHVTHGGASLTARGLVSVWRRPVPVPDARAVPDADAGRPRRPVPVPDARAVPDADAGRPRRTPGRTPAP